MLRRCLPLLTVVLVACRPDNAPLPSPNVTGLAIVTVAADDTSRGEPPPLFRFTASGARPPAAPTPGGPGSDELASLTAAQAAGLFAGLPAPGPSGAGDLRLATLSPLPPPLDATPAPPLEAPAPAAAPSIVRPVPGAPPPLEIARVQPDPGEIPVAGGVTIVFSDPVAPIAEVEPAEVPPAGVRLEPQPPGLWRWINARTLVFEAKPRLPMATSYRLVVDAGVKSLAGGALRKKLEVNFQTPPPRLADISHERETVGLTPVIGLLFDQAIAPSSVEASAQFRFAWRRIPVRLATREEVEADGELKSWSAGSAPDRIVFVRPLEPLPAGMVLDLEIKPGLDSAEGPLVTRAAQSRSVTVRGPFRVMWVGGRQADEIRPNEPFEIRFSNPIDPRSFHADSIAVVPDRGRIQRYLRGQAIMIEAPKLRRGEAWIRLDPGLTDRFGQRLTGRLDWRVQVLPVEPGLVDEWPSLITRPTGGPVRLPVRTVNEESLLVTVRIVRPEQWPDYLSARLAARPGREFRRVDWPGSVVSHEGRRLAGPYDALHESVIDLDPYLRGGTGQLLVSVRAIHSRRLDEEPLEVATWVQVTNLGLDAFWDDELLLARVTRLESGAPVSGAVVSLQPGGPQAPSNSDGLAAFPLSNLEKRLVVVRSGGEEAFLPGTRDEFAHEAGWRRHDRPPEWLWYVTDERGLYRPGETAHLKGWVRRLDPGPRARLLRPAGLDSISFLARDSRWIRIGEGTVALTPAGGFEIPFALPGDAATGHVHFEFGHHGEVATRTRASHDIRVEEYRPPEFEVRLRTQPGPHRIGSDTEVSVEAAYLNGGALSEARVEWTFRARPTSYEPPGWGGFQFGRGWRDDRRGRGNRQSWEDLPPLEWTGHTGIDGVDRVRLAFEGVRYPTPVGVEIEAVLHDLSEQTWTKNSGLLVHPAAHYVGLRSRKQFYQPGNPLALDVVVIDLEGRALGHRPVDYEIVRLEVDPDHPQAPPERIPAGSGRITSRSRPVDPGLLAGPPGDYILTARIADDDGHPNETSLALRVVGPLPPVTRRPPARSQVEFLADQPGYRPGEVARVHVNSGFRRGEALLILNHRGIVGRISRPLVDRQADFEIPIESWQIPRLEIDLVVTGQEPDSSAGREPDRASPRASGQEESHLSLPISGEEDRLRLTVESSTPEPRPGDSLSIRVTVLDARSRPAPGAEVALFAVDEAVLALSRFSHPDPLTSMQVDPSGPSRSLKGRQYLWRPERDSRALWNRLRRGRAISLSGSELNSTSISATRQRISHAELRSLPVDTYQQAIALPAGMVPQSGELRFRGGRSGEVSYMIDGIRVSDPLDGGSASLAAPPPILRREFRSLAFFAGAATTDARGQVSLPFRLPHNLTRYRITALAAAGERAFGLADTSLKVRLPVMARPSPPRFLNAGDEFELPIVLVNLESEPAELAVGVRGVNVEWSGAAGYRGRIPAGGRVTARFRGRALHPGTLPVQYVVRGALSGDAGAFELPVRAPETPEAFATYGELDTGAVVHQLRVPADADTVFGGLEISTASTAISRLEDAARYLLRYPYECAEQKASRLMALAALHGLGAGFAEGSPGDPEARRLRMEADVRDLAAMQRVDGGFGFWSGRGESWPYLSVHVGLALAGASRQGMGAPESIRQQLLKNLQSFESSLPPRYGPELRRALRALAYYTRHELGDPDPAGARALVREVGAEALTIESCARLLVVLAHDPASSPVRASLEKRIRAAIVDESGRARIVESWFDGRDQFLLHTDLRSEAAVLEATLATDPRGELAPRLVRGIVSRQQNGRWRTTQENAAALVALCRYFEIVEKEVPDFTGRLWVDEQNVYSRAWAGRSREIDSRLLPMSELVTGPPLRSLLLGHEGRGRLYYRLGLRYAHRDARSEPLDAGFSVHRTYEAIDDSADVFRRADGAWEIRAGARVRIRLTLAARSVRYHVALVDPLPGGFEPINAALAGQGSDGPRPAGGWRMSRRHSSLYFDHENLRDDRAEVFCGYLREGSFEYSYQARATAAGDFTAPPPRAEEMYEPEIFGRGASDRVVIVR